MRGLEAEKSEPDSLNRRQAEEKPASACNRPVDGQKSVGEQGQSQEQLAGWYQLRLSDFSPAAIAESGQCFRMFPGTEPGAYWLIAKGRLLRLRETKNAVSGAAEYAFSCTKEEFRNIWTPYFDLKQAYSRYRAVVPAEDRYLRRAMRYGRGIRILRQEPFETLISFIISQRRSVPAIRTAVAKLSECFGTPVTGPESAALYAFPTPEQLAQASLEQLSACGLGYRTGFVSACARRVAEGSLDLDALAALSTPELIAALMELQGVGVKVASCVALFGYHRLDASPVDVWMDRVIQQVYGGTFPACYRACAGVLQQYLFYYARMEKQF